MPGLVGATLRNNSVLSSFRSHISYYYLTDRQCESKQSNGIVTLKLFNILIKELGQYLLENGVLVQAELLKSLLKTERSKKDSAIETVIVDGKKQDWKNTGNCLWNTNNTEIILLVVLI